MVSSIKTINIDRFYAANVQKVTEKKKEMGSERECSAENGKMSKENQSESVTELNNYDESAISLN